MSNIVKRKVIEMDIHNKAIVGYFVAAIAATIDQLSGAGVLSAIFATLGPMGPALAIAVPVFTHAIAKSLGAPNIANNGSVKS